MKKPNLYQSRHHFNYAKRSRTAYEGIWIDIYDLVACGFKSTPLLKLKRYL